MIVGNQNIFQNQQTMNMSMMSVPSHQSFIIMVLVNIAFQCSITHHIALNEVQ